jgi:uncharacterized membrane protein
LLRRSLLSEIAGAALVLAIGYMIGLITRNISIGSEIISRTSPSILDLLIALVGGRRRVYLCVARLTRRCGGRGHRHGVGPSLGIMWHPIGSAAANLAAGAFLLFLANFTAIAVGAMTVFLLAGHRPRLRIAPARCCYRD